MRSALSQPLRLPRLQLSGQARPSQAGHWPGQRYSFTQDPGGLSLKVDFRHHSTRFLQRTVSDRLHYRRSRVVRSTWLHGRERALVNPGPYCGSGSGKTDKSEGSPDARTHATPRAASRRQGRPTGTLLKQIPPYPWPRRFGSAETRDWRNRHVDATHCRARENRRCWRIRITMASTADRLCIFCRAAALKRNHYRFPVLLHPAKTDRDYGDRSLNCVVISVSSPVGCHQLQLLPCCTPLAVAFSKRRATRSTPPPPSACSAPSPDPGRHITIPETQRLASPTMVWASPRTRFCKPSTRRNL